MPCTPIAPGGPSTPRKPGSPWTATGARRWAAPWPASASSTSPPTPRRPAAAANASTAPSRIASSMSSALPASPVPAANRYLTARFLAAYDARFAHPPADPASAFVPLGGVDLTHILCHEEARTVGQDNTVALEGVRLQIDKQLG